MKSLKFFFLAALAGMMFASCENNNPVATSQVSNITFTECNKNLLKSADGTTDRVDVEFTNIGVNITHYGLEVHCDFDTVLVTQNLQNGVLNITEQGEPNNAKCMCNTDVSYSINGISKNNVDSIVINGEVVWRANQQPENSLIGKWSVTPSYCSSIEITANNINFLVESNETWSYQWLSNDSIKIVRPGYTTHNKVIFHTQDSVTIEGFWLSDAAIFPREDYDATLIRIGGQPQQNCDQDVIISETEYANAPNSPFTIISMQILDNCLKIKFGASGCSGSTWVVKLIDEGTLAYTYPASRTLRLSLDNQEMCDAYFGKEISFNIEDLQVQNENRLMLNISGNFILYEY